MSMELAYTAFTSIKSFLERVACLDQPGVVVLDSRPDFIHVELRGVPFGRELTTITDGEGESPYDFIVYDLLPQCNIPSDCYQVKEETLSMYIMRIHGRSIRFFMNTRFVPIDDDTDDYFNDLKITFDLEPNEYSKFLDMINRG